MLTGDENIVEADCVVFWRIKDAGLYLFKIKNPELAVKIAAESALRYVAPVGEKDEYVARAMRNVTPYLYERAAVS